MQSFADMLAGVASQDDTPHTYPFLEAQMDMLNHLMNVFVSPKAFSRGDRVHYPQGLGPLRPEARAGLALIFWRDLDLDSYHDKNLIRTADSSERLTLPSIDCLVASFDGQGCVRFYVSCKALLMPGQFRP